MNANTDLINISRSILLMTGWASVILFSDLKSVEYADHTIDLYRLAARKDRAVCIRFLLCVVTIVLFAAGVFFLSLLRISEVGRLEYTADIFGRMMISCLCCCCLLGSVSMTAGDVFRRMWPGLAVGLVINILLSQIRTASVFNLYLFYYFPDNGNVCLWFCSILFYTMISFGILSCHRFYRGR